MSQVTSLIGDQIEKTIPSVSHAQEIGKGGQKIVFRCQINGDPYAIKFIRCPEELEDSSDDATDAYQSEPEVITRAKREIETMRDCASEHMVKLGPIGLDFCVIDRQKLAYYTGKKQGPDKEKKTGARQRQNQRSLHASCKMTVRTPIAIGEWKNTFVWPHSDFPILISQSDFHSDPPHSDPFGLFLLCNRVCRLSVSDPAKSKGHSGQLGFHQVRMRQRWICFTSHRNRRRRFWQIPNATSDNGPRTLGSGIALDTVTSSRAQYSPASSVVLPYRANSIEAMLPEATKLKTGFPAP